MVDPADFLDDENWPGSNISLAIQLGSSTAHDADGRVLRALRAVWEHPSLQGCYRDRWSAIDHQERMAAPVPANLDEAEHLYGLAILPDGQRVVCFTFVSSRGSYGDGCDWLLLCLPSGALDRAGYFAAYAPEPFLSREQLRRWQRIMDDWFVPIAAAVQRHAGFRLAVLGEEAPHCSSWLPDGPFEGELPRERTATFLVPTATGVEYHGDTT